MKIKQVLKSIIYYYYLQDFYWSSKLAESEVGFFQSIKSIEKKSSGLSLKDLGIVIQKQKHLFVLDGFIFAKSLVDKAKATFSVDVNNELMVDIDGLRVNIQTKEDLFILNEIFVSGVYNLITTKPIIVWDIGMNVGFASLYFALKENVLAVIGHEPFKPTYAQALNNFSCNPEVSKKIKADNYGMGVGEQLLIVEYNYDCKGSIGVKGISENQKYKEWSTSQEEIKIKKSSDVFDSIVNQHPGIDIVVKIDCEGAEYEIIQSLYSEGKLDLINMLMIEWHYKGPSQIVKNLIDAGFTVLSLSPSNEVYGMLYAVRS